MNKYITRDIVFKINDELQEHVMILKNNEEEISIFTDFFYENIKNFSLRNSSYGTKKKYAYIVVKFLNYIFIDLNIEKIENLRLEMLQEFLNAYSRGWLKKDEINKGVNADTVHRANYILKNFIYWIYNKKLKESRERVFKMKYIKLEDFTFSIGFRQGRYRINSVSKEILNNIVSYDVTKKVVMRKKVVNANWEIIRRLLKIADENDPILSFAIALGAFAGLRAGEVVQMNKGRLRKFNASFTGCWIDLTEDVILRSDNVVTGHIKKKRNAQIHGGFIECIKKYYLKHIDYLRYKGIQNLNNALFVNEGGKSKGEAITKRTYLNRFSRLVAILYNDLIREIAVGRTELLEITRILEDGKLVPHSLRYFYTQLIEEIEDGNHLVISYYRGDSNLASQEVYRKNETKEKVRRVENLIFEKLGLK